ncbi:UDP-glucose:undecaprenyl-phosphate glucose-1-phosphate transferase [compost metagenome]
MWFGKRLFDTFCASIGLVILSPLFTFVALWIKRDSEGPIFFRQVRVGLNGVPFRIHKFRTMRSDAEAKGLQITIGADPRITPSGQFLRKYKIDELPQLIDVVCGTMSLVGPRPEVPKYVEQYPASIKAVALSVRPGITDRASIEFKDENEILGTSTQPEKDYIEKILPIKLKYHLEYASNASFLGDLKLIFLTLKEIFISR